MRQVNAGKENVAVLVHQLEKMKDQLHIVQQVCRTAASLSLMIKRIPTNTAVRWKRDFCPFSQYRCLLRAYTETQLEVFVLFTVWKGLISARGCLRRR